MHNGCYNETQYLQLNSEYNEKIQQCKNIIKDIFDNNSYRLSLSEKENFKSIIAFRELLENIQNKIFKKSRKLNFNGSKYSITLISPDSLTAYCNGLKNMKDIGIPQEQLLSEITTAISCINNTQLSSCKINKQFLLQKIFFPFETYMSQKMINIKNKIKYCGFEKNTLVHNQNIITAEETANNLLKLIKALKRFPMYISVRNKIQNIHGNNLTKQQKLQVYEQQEISTNYVNFLITRLKNQANKLADIASTYLDKYTYKKLKKISKNKYTTRKNII